MVYLENVQDNRQLLFPEHNSLNATIKNEERVFVSQFRIGSTRIPVQRLTPSLRFVTFSIRLPLYQYLLNIVYSIIVRPAWRTNFTQATKP